MTNLATPQPYPQHIDELQPAHEVKHLRRRGTDRPSAVRGSIVVKAAERGIDHACSLTPAPVAAEKV